VLPFSDVGEEDWFYPYVRYMYCEGVVSGYPDGTFRPNASTTRGQTAKIVTLAFGFDINTEGGPHFSDVGEVSTFYPYIETLYNLEVISGYGDGTFGPNNTITRGQIAKVVVGAAAVADPPNWALDPPPTNTFEDVPVGSTFFAYVEAAAWHGLLQGYPCGSPPAGPCGPDSKPYFLPYSNATRAQISKVVYLAVTYAPGTR
jgi:hypothetical protein